jgi:hypothetical protein
MVEFCRGHGLKHEVCGKVIVATKRANLALRVGRDCNPSRDSTKRIPHFRDRSSLCACGPADDS